MIKSNFFQESLLESMAHCSELVDANMAKYLPIDFSDSKIVEAMRYSALSGGKKIRPFLLLSCADIFAVPYQNCLEVASAIEFSHVYSLIHDDLPAMDNDDFRRGKLSNHKKFDEATAILAGDALLTLAFEILANNNLYGAEIRCELIKILSSALGFRGMIGGQMMDIENVHKANTVAQICHLHHLKTGKLFMASAECGAILGRASNAERDAIKEYAKELGLAFQIKDDILDYAHNNNKNIQDNNSIVAIIGLEKSEKLLIESKDKMMASLAGLGKDAHTLKSLIDFVINRNK